MTATLLIQWKLDCSTRNQERKNSPITMPVVKPSKCSILTTTLTIQFSVDGKRHQNFPPIFDSVRFSQGPRGGRSGNFNAPTHPPVLYAEAYTFVFSPRPPPPQPRSKIYCAGPVSLDRIALCFWIQLRLRPKWKPALNRWSTSDSFFLFFSNNNFVFMHLLISVYCITSKGAALYCLVPYATSRIWLSSFCRKRKGRLNNTSTQ